MDQRWLSQVWRHGSPSTRLKTPCLCCGCLAARVGTFSLAAHSGTNDPSAVPNFAHYNAYRWLRDSGFNPGRFVSSNAVVAAQTDITEGLIRFSQWRAGVPEENGLGVLGFGKVRDRRAGLDLGALRTKRWMALGMDGLIGASGIAGAILIWRLTRRNPKRNQTNYPEARQDL
jgi:hypothetical protein